MPTPVSLTDTSTNPSLGVAATSIRPPSGVNLIAFDIVSLLQGRDDRLFSWP